MATLSEIPVRQLGDQAREAPGPGRVIVTIIAGFFYVLGFLAGGLWRGLAFCAVSARFGYWQGRGFTDAEIAAKVAARRPQPSQPQPAGARA